MYEFFDIKDRVVAITGGTGVLGESMVEYLAAHGAKVAVLARNKEKGDLLIEKVKANGGEAMFLVTDVTDEAVLKQNAKDIVEKYGKIDVLINGAGGNMPGATIGPNSNIFDLKIDDFRKVVDLNLMGSVIPTVVFSEFMVKLDSIQNTAFIGTLIKVKNREDLEKITVKNLPELRLNPKKEDLNKEAQYPGGFETLRKQVADLFYTDSVLPDQKLLKTNVVFVVERDGSIANVQAQGENFTFNRQACNSGSV